MPFLTADPVLALLPDGCDFRLEAEVRYQGRAQLFTIPAGFRTDLASIPPAVAWLIAKLGAYSKAAIVHDWLCVQLALAHAGDLDAGLLQADSRDTDGLFRRIAREQGVDWLTRWLLWTGVRWGALVNPARRSGWLRDAPRVICISVLAAPLALPTGLLALISVGLLRGANALVSRVIK